MIHFAFYVPVSHAEEVKKSVFLAGAGRIGNYEYCSFESEGTGQFRPMKGSQAFVGQIGEIERVSELKIEMVLEDQVLKAVIDALKKSHPYETPAYYAIKTLNI